MLVSKIRDIKYVVVKTEEDALLLENNLIKRYKPRYNVLLKDDKSYPWIAVTNEMYPRVFITHHYVRAALPISVLTAMCLQCTPCSIFAGNSISHVPARLS